MADKHTIELSDHELTLLQMALTAAVDMARDEMAREQAQAVQDQKHVEYLQWLKNTLPAQVALLNRLQSEV